MHPKASFHSVYYTYNLSHLNCNSFITKVGAVIEGYELILNYETFHCLSSLIYKADFLIYPESVKLKI